MIKRYLIFGSCQYYPSGGAGDVIGDVDTIAEVRKIVKGGQDAYDVLDLQERRWLAEAEWADEK